MKIKLVLFTILWSSVLSAQEKTDFTLQEAIDYALVNAYAIQTATNNIELADEKVWETTAIGLPQINGNVEYQNFLKQQVQLIPSDFFGGTPGEFQPVIFGTKQNMNATVTLSQLLFDGSYIVGLQSAKTFKKISESGKIKTEFAVKQAVVNAYSNVLLVEERILILEKNKLILEQNLDQTNKLVLNGFGEEQDAEQQQLTLSAINNEINKTTRYEITAYKLLNISLGIEVDAHVVLTNNFEDLLLENLDLGLAQTNFDITTHIDYLIAENNKTSQELLVRFEKSKALPSLNAFVNYGSGANGENFEFFQNDQKWYGSSLLGVSLNIPIFSSLQRSAKTQQAKLNLQIAERELTETEQKLKINVQDARTDYQFAIDNFQNSKENLELAERIEKKENIKFFEGVSTSFDLTSAQNQLYAKQQNYLEGIQYLINSKTTLENALNIK
jgi:outer membrane protein TolC